jgi:ribosomal protein S18 acetylase RimI-like enzyme
MPSTRAQTLAAAARHRWKGLGSRLVELAKSRWPEGLQLWTFASNVDAQRFYERHGFVVVEATDGSGNEEKQPDLRLAWPAA